MRQKIPTPLRRYGLPPAAAAAAAAAMFIPAGASLPAAAAPAVDDSAVPIDELLLESLVKVTPAPPHVPPWVPATRPEFLCYLYDIISPPKTVPRSLPMPTRSHFHPCAPTPATPTCTPISTHSPLDTLPQHATRARSLAASRRARPSRPTCRWRTCAAG